MHGVTYCQMLSEEVLVTLENAELFFSVASQMDCEEKAGQ